MFLVTSNLFLYTQSQHIAQYIYFLTWVKSLSTVFPCTPWHQHIKYLLGYNYYQLALSLSAAEYQNVQTNISQKKSAENLTCFFHHSLLQDAESKSETSQAISAREHFVFTDTDGQVYHITVEGNTVKDGARIPPDVSPETCVSFISIFFTSYPPELLQGYPHWSLHKVIPSCFISLPLH